MKYIAVVSVILLLLLVFPVSAGDLDPIINKDVPIFIEKPLPYVTLVVSYTERTTITKFIVDIFSEIFGWEQEITETVKNEITVDVAGDVVAVIPNNSPFRDMKVHEYCLRYQYGTKNWRVCEQGMVSV